MKYQRAESLAIEKVASVATEAAMKILHERAGKWNAEKVEIGLFLDGGIMGGKIFCKTLDGVEAADLVKTASGIHATLARSFDGLDLQVELVDNIITMGGKIGPDILFEQFGP